MRNSRLRKRLKPILTDSHQRKKPLRSSLTNLRLRKRFTIGMPATYCICVQGFLEKRWAERLGNMHITKRSREGQVPASTLIIEVRDQAELMGVLNGLYELHLPILLVERITENHGGREGEQGPDKTSLSEPEGANCK